MRFRSDYMDDYLLHSIAFLFQAMNIDGIRQLKKETISK